MIIKYKCKCMKKEREIVVTDRVLGSDIAFWMERVVRHSLSYDHSSLNPLCTAQTMDYLKIPMDEGGGGIGVPTEKE